MLYGRDEMGQREEIFVLNEPPFYKLVQTNLKACVLRWVEDTVRVIKPDERMIMVICAHGGSGGAIFLNSSNGSESLEVEEIYSALELLPNRVSVLFINLACYSGSWGQLTRLGANRNIMVEAASSERRTSRNHMSASLKCRCSFFGHALIQELKRFPDGLIVEHTERIKEEMKHIPPKQRCPSARFFFSSRSIRSNLMTDFLSSPGIVQQVLNASSPEKRDKERRADLSKVKQDALPIRYWKRLFGDLTGNAEAKGISKIREYSSTGDLTSNSELDAISRIRKYVNNLGSAANDGNHIELVSACYDVLRGDGNAELIQAIKNTITWQEDQIKLVQKVLDHLKNQGLLRHTLSEKAAGKRSTRRLDDTSRKTLVQVRQRLLKIASVRNLLRSDADKAVPVLYQEGFDFLLQNIIFNYSGIDSLERMAREIEEFMTTPSLTVGHIPSSLTIHTSSSAVHMPSSSLE